MRQRYWYSEVALIRAFHAAIDTQVAAELMVENSLFYNLLIKYGFNQRQAGRSMLGRAPETVLQVTGLELLEQARQQGSGVIVANHHCLAQWWLTRETLDKLAQTSIFNVEGVIRDKQLDKEIASSILYSRQLEIALKALQRGEFVAIAPDANEGTSPRHAIHFHGRQKTMRFGFAELALLTGGTCASDAE